MKKLITIFGLTLALAIIFGSSVCAQKFGFIDSEKIQMNYKEWNTAQEQFNTELKAWEDEAAQMEQDLREMVTDYEKQKLVLSADKKLEREAAINAKDQALTAFTREISGPNGRAEKRMAELVKPLYDKIQASIEKLAIDDNYDFIFNSAGLAYAKKDLDVTDKVIEILEEGD